MNIIRSGGGEDRRYVSSANVWCVSRYQESVFRTNQSFAWDLACLHLRGQDRVHQRSSTVRVYHLPSDPARFFGA